MSMSPKNGSFHELTLGLATHEKIAVQNLMMELSGADEPNLLDEEDMHVFDSRPLADPLHLVCCSTCKRPIKASQYAAHAERCRPFDSGCEPILEISSDDSDEMKPPRKERKVIQETNGYQGIITEEWEKSDSIYGNNMDSSESNFNDQSDLLSVQPDNIQGYKIREDLMTRRDVPSSALTRYLNDVDVLENGLVSDKSPCLSEAPPPLATKIYYYHGTDSLRLQLSRLYHGANAREVGVDSKCTEQIQDNEKISPQLSYSNELLSGQLSNENSPIKHSGQLLGQSSEHSLEDLEQLQPGTSFSNQFHDNSLSEHYMSIAAPQEGVIKSSTAPKPSGNRE